MALLISDASILIHMETTQLLEFMFRLAEKNIQGSAAVHSGVERSKGQDACRGQTFATTGNRATVAAIVIEQPTPESISLLRKNTLLKLDWSAILGICL